MQGATPTSSAAQLCSDTESLLHGLNTAWDMAVQACASSCLISSNLQEVAMAVAVAMAVKAALKVWIPLLRQGFPMGCLHTHPRALSVQRPCQYKMRQSLAWGHRGIKYNSEELCKASSSEKDVCLSCVRSVQLACNSQDWRLCAGGGYGGGDGYQGEGRMQGESY